jgi:hypothetical protein
MTHGTEVALHFSDFLILGDGLGVGDRVGRAMYMKEKEVTEFP